MARLPPVIVISEGEDETYLSKAIQMIIDMVLEDQKTPKAAGGGRA